MVRKYWPLGLIVIIGLLSLASKALTTGSGLDLRGFWLAGRFWLSGQDPYGADFPTQFEMAFKIDIGGSGYFPYPPYWFPISTALSLLPFPAARDVWRLLNIALLIGGTHLTARSFAEGNRYWITFFSGLAYVSLMESTGSTLFFGQTSIIVYFGWSAFAFGILRNNYNVLVVGLVFLALKPNVGLIAFAAVVAQPRWKYAVLPPMFLVLLAVSPLLVTGSLAEQVREFLANLSRYAAGGAGSVFGGDKLNSAPNFTGLIHLLSFSYSPFLVVGPALLGLLLFSRTTVNTSVICLLVAVALFFLPLHTYDLVALAIPLMAIISAPAAGRWFIAAGLLICMRAGNLAAITGIASEATASYFQGSLLSSVGLLLVLIGAVYSFFLDRDHGLRLGLHLPVQAKGSKP